MVNAFLHRLISFSKPVFILFLVITCSCNDDSVKPGASGRGGEILVVIDTSLWKGKTGLLLKDSLMAPYPGLPQQEPIFRLIHVSEPDFRNILKLHRNILQVLIIDDTSGINYNLDEQYDVWAKGQLVLTLHANSESWLEAAMLNFLPVIREQFTEVDRNRMIHGYKKLSSPVIKEQLEKAYGFSLPVTRDFYVAAIEDEYCWIRRETEHVSLNMQIYSVPYVSQDQLEPDYVISIRDSVSKARIPGPSDGSYMTTEQRFPFIVNSTSIDDKYALTVKGLWRTEGDFMGGPFTTYTIYNEAKGELLMIDTFIYSPKLDKKDYVRQLDAIVHGIGFQ